MASRAEISSFWDWLLSDSVSFSCGLAGSEITGFVLNHKEGKKGSDWVLVRRESCSKMKSAILGVSEVLDLKLGIKSY